MTIKTKLTKTERIERELQVERQRKAHHRALESLCSDNIGDLGVSIWRKLRRVEVAAHKQATDRCNVEGDFKLAHGGDGSEEELLCERVEVDAREKVQRILGRRPTGYHFNWDPRGYTLKIDASHGFIPDGMHRDMGGFGILAPLID